LTGGRIAGGAVAEVDQDGVQQVFDARTEPDITRSCDNYVDITAR
jgi:hypothetical protein